MVIELVKVRKDLTGQVFGKLTVVKQADDYVNPKGVHYAKWWCRCACGNPNLIAVNASDLKDGTTQSCGCLLSEITAQRNAKENKKDLSGEYGIIWSTNTNEEIYFDMEDSKDILKHTWHINAQGYPATNINKKLISMHAFLGFKWPDHYNRNKLDNRKANLISCTRSDNQRNHPMHKNNTSGYVGVSHHSKNNSWIAQISVKHKNIYLGSFKTKEEALYARLKAEEKYFGNFAPQRHLFEQYGIECDPEDKIKGGDSNE